MKETSPDTRPRIRGEKIVNNVLKIKKWDSRVRIKKNGNKGKLERIRLRKLPILTKEGKKFVYSCIVTKTKTAKGVR